MLSEEVMRLNQLLLTCVLFTLPHSAPVWAGPFEDAIQAYRQGDFDSAITHWQTLALDGDARSQAALARIYQLGQGVAVDPLQADYWREEAKFNAKSNADAIFREIDQLLSISSATLAQAPTQSQVPTVAQADSVIATNSTSAPAQNTAAAVSLPKIASATTAKPMTQEQETAFMKGMQAYESKRFSNAFAAWLALAEQGVADAQFNVGAMYMNGRGVKADGKQAIPWLEKAAAQGLVDAYYSLGRLYQVGQDVPADPAKAASYLKVAAEAGQSRAMKHLGQVLLRLPADGPGAEARGWLSKAIAAGDLGARYWLGMSYLQGQGGAQDVNKGIAELTAATEERNISAMIVLANLYEQGSLVEQNDRLAFRFFTRAAQLGNDEAQVRLAESYLRAELGQRRDMRKAVSWLQRASAQGNTLAQAYLSAGKGRLRVTETARELDSEEQEEVAETVIAATAEVKAEVQAQKQPITAVQPTAREDDADDLYQQAQDLLASNGDSAAAINLLKNAADRGHRQSSYRLGQLLLNGAAGIAADPPAALPYIQMAADSGMSAASFQLGMMLLNGNVAQKNPANAAIYIQNAAEDGNYDAQYQLGMLYEVGNGVPQSDEDAVKWYRMAAEQEHPAAMANLAELLEKGYGVPKDEEAAFEMFEAAAAKGVAKAQNALGLFYKHGRVVPKNEGKAVQMFAMAVRQGYPNAMYQLGWMHEHGRGVAQDLVKARDLYQSAAAKGDTMAKSQLKRLMR
jgi:hypothetical protein